MSKSINFTRGAQSDLRQVFQWYESQKPGLGQNLIHYIDNAAEAITTRSFSFAVLHGEDRRVLVARFPYAVYFRVLEAEIVVTAVVHGARKPEKIRRLLRRKH